MTYLFGHLLDSNIFILFFSLPILYRNVLFYGVHQIVEFTAIFLYYLWIIHAECLRLSFICILLALHITYMTPTTVIPLSKFPRVYFHVAGKNRKQVSEFETFLGYLLKRDKVSLQFYCLFIVLKGIGGFAYFSLH